MKRRFPGMGLVDRAMRFHAYEVPRCPGWLRPHVVAWLVRVNRWSRRWAITYEEGMGGVRCPVCLRHSCWVHCYECGQDCEEGDHTDSCETGAGLFTVDIREALAGGIECPGCETWLDLGDKYMHRHCDDPECSHLDLLCVGCAALPTP